MSRLSVSFSRALAKGRVQPATHTRANVLASLLRKRAAAQTHGADDLEAMLREQIRWALPMERG